MLCGLILSFWICLLNKICFKYLKQNKSVTYLPIRNHHCYSAEHYLEVFWKFLSPSITGIHCNEKSKFRVEWNRITITKNLNLINKLNRYFIKIFQLPIIGLPEELYFDSFAFSTSWRTSSTTFKLVFCFLSPSSQAINIKNIVFPFLFGISLYYIPFRSKTLFLLIWHNVGAWPYILRE